MDFTSQMLEWYEHNKRDLPWRRIRDPYLIWVSEIILQQTRIDQGLPYYQRFITAFPDIRSLATADEKDIMKIWQGLGYYSRAVNMHKASLIIMNDFNGQFPGSYEAIRGLPGIGDYTAAAIASIAFHLPFPVVDGNVIRFFSRHFGVKEPVNSAKAKQIIREIATGLIDHQHPGSFNQAIMEYGARTCIPGIPVCDSCCFEQSCFAYSHNSVGLLPVKNKKVRQRTRYFNYLVITSDNENAWIMRKRVAQDIWKGLYDFPLIETAKLLSMKSLKATRDWSLIEKMNPGPLIRCSGQFRHILTHQVIVARFFRISVSKVNVVPEGCIQVRDLTKIPVPRLIEKYLQNLV